MTAYSTLKWRERRDRLMAEGRCVQCAEPRGDDRKARQLCVACAARAVDRMKLYRERRGAGVLYAYTKAYRLKRMEAGQCTVCGAAKGPDRIEKYHCATCARRHTLSVSASRRKRQEAGA